MFTTSREVLSTDSRIDGALYRSLAGVVVARHARDKDDLTDLLGALGLPRGEDDLTPLLPHLPAQDDSPTGAKMTTEPVNAFTATAASMLANGDSPEHVRDILGLSKDELTNALQHMAEPGPADRTADTTGSPEPVAAAPGSTKDPGGIEALLAWAQDHATAAIRNRAARIRSHLTELTQRRNSEAAQRAAEERVAQAKAELEAAQEQLREVKTGGRAATTRQNATPPTPAPAPAPTTARRSREDLAAVRAWARAHGHQVADRGTPARAVLDAYDAAHRSTGLAEAG
ncbi:histone-like nucleoid-structuring protein Lsr2 [Streptomyces sp. MNP-20]|uniref:Lsr2 family DNA-binding protein n=1 Tax=Streptomyces sp. MNP-20 TaxID=2721165 RepID=UPI001557F0CF|nr:histone-like nucleoid-structuring protein Lsr2 [Streptomyces sp. MNP-20]